MIMYDHSHFLKHLEMIQIYFNFVCLYRLHAMVAGAVAQPFRSDACLLYFARPIAAKPGKLPTLSVLDTQVILGL